MRSKILVGLILGLLLAISAMPAYGILKQSDISIDAPSIAELNRTIQVEFTVQNIDYVDLPIMIIVLNETYRVVAEIELEHSNLVMDKVNGGYLDYAGHIDFNSGDRLITLKYYVRVISNEDVVLTNTYFTDVQSSDGGMDDEIATPMIFLFIIAGVVGMITVLFGWKHKHDRSIPSKSMGLEIETGDLDLDIRI